MRLLVTGGTGFLGRPLCEALAASGNEVYCLVRSKPDRISPFKNEVRFVHTDLRSMDFIDHLPHDLDGIIHLAQAPNYSDDIENAYELNLVNVLATARLVEFGYRTGCRLFLFASTGSVYEPFDGVQTETNALAPSSAYSCSKLAGEMVLSAYSASMDISIVRPFFLFGPGQENRLLPNLAKRIHDGVPVVLNGGEQGLRLNPIFVADAVSVLIDGIRESWRGCFNLAGQETVTLKDLSEMIGRTIGKKPVFQLNEAGISKQIIGDIDRLRVLKPDFNPIPLSEAIERTFARRQ